MDSGSVIMDYRGRYLLRALYNLYVEKKDYDYD